MSRWEQHYYTWSTNSLSGNKVGLGIVAASVSDDRNYMRIMENQGARSEVLREADSLTIERMCYCEELPGFVRTGATPCESGADLRNNKFVHIYSLKGEQNLAPEDYLAPLSYKRQWQKERKLTPLVTEQGKKDRGRKGAVRLLAAFGLSGRLEELLYCVYRCLLAGEKPLSIVSSERRQEEFGDFSRQMMILIHYLLPKSLRKEADYVSYVNENSQEAHFLFRKEGGNAGFDMDKRGARKDYVLLEKEFYHNLAKAFLDDNNDFEKLMEKLDHFLTGLADKRNQLEKCIFAFMAAEAGKMPDKGAYFTGVERLMYWARKDDTLLPALKDATKDLDFHSMGEEELLNYTSLLLTGAGGKTKDLAYGQLNRMLSYYYRTQNERFDHILDRICKKNHGVYEQILKDNEKEDSFTKKVLYQPIENKIQLEEALRNHESFLQDEDYRYFVTQSAYQIYANTKSREKRLEIEKLGKQADQELFVRMKQKDVEKVIYEAKNLEQLLNMADQMEITDLEEPIRAVIYNWAMDLFDGNEVRGLFYLGEKLSFENKLQKDLYHFYEKQLEPTISKAGPKELIGISFWNQKEEAGTAIYLKALEDLCSKRYLQLLESQRSQFYHLSPKEWVRFVLKLTGSGEGINKKKAKEIISVTKAAILEKKDIYFLAEANQTLKNHGVTPISCTKRIWDTVDPADFASVYEQIDDITLVKCDDSLVYQAMEILYHYIDLKTNKEDTKKLTQICRKDGELAERLFEMFCGLWAVNEELNLDFFYDLMAQTLGEEEAKALALEAAAENSQAKNQLKEYLKEREKEEAMRVRGKEKAGFLSNVLKDIMSGSLYGVLLGFYGYIFVSFREIKAFGDSYHLSVMFLLALIGCYLVASIGGRQKRQTPGGMIYILGIGVFLMNLGLAIDNQGTITLVFLAAGIVSFLFKLAEICLFNGKDKKGTKQE